MSVTRQNLYLKMLCVTLHGTGVELFKYKVHKQYRKSEYVNREGNCTSQDCH